VQQGTLTLGNVNALQKSTLQMDAADSGTVALGVAGTNTYNIGGLSGSRSLDLAANTFSVGGNNATTTFSGTLSGTGGLRKVGTGQLILSGSNTFTGGTTVTAGTLTLGAANRLHDTSSLTISGGEFDLGGFADTVSTVTLSGGSITNGSLTASTVSASLGTIDGALSGSTDFTKSGSGQVVLRGVNTHSFTSTAGSSAFTLTTAPAGILDGVISGTGGFTWNSFGSLTLNAPNTYDGGTIIADGSVYAGHSTAFGSGGITIGKAGSKIGAAADVTIANNISLSANGFVDTCAFAMTASGEVSGSGSLTKSGSGTLTLSSANTYTGGTTVSTGTLVIGNTTAAGTGSITQTDGTSLLKLDTTGTILNDMSIYNVTSNQTMAISGNITAHNTTYDVADGTTLSIDGTISGNGGVTKNGTGMLELNTSNTYTGDTVVNAGTLQIGDGGTTGNLGGGSVSNNATLVINRSNSIMVANAISGTGALVQDGTGTTTLSANNSYSGATTISAGTLEIGAAGRLGGGSYSGNIIKTGAFIMGSNSNQTLSGVISGNGALTKAGSGTLTLSGSNSYTGPTSLNTGTVVIGNANALGTSGNVTFNSGGLQYGSGITADISSRIKNSSSAILVDTNGNNVTFSSGIDSTNSGGLTKNGNGSLTLSSANSYTGGTTLNTGTLVIGNKHGRRRHRHHQAGQRRLAFENRHNRDNHERAGYLPCRCHPKRHLVRTNHREQRHMGHRHGRDAHRGWNRLRSRRGH